MVKETEAFDPNLDDDLALLTETLEEVLKSSGDPTDQKYIELKSKAEQVLEDVKSHVSHTSDHYYYRAKQAAYRADDYVHEKPWQGIGIGAAAGLMLGLLLARR
ncbi:stress response protein ElaB [Candidatus Pantoea persica]|uniref:stress response protein ElaB n=1 Tax=Candidatus Pantoea persica TaxID=2518128 RepID=UPI00215D9337|nr:stress response protein ElaB [Candidatus Pantoea persica]MBA2816620.1 protein ElaB [Candidatus Pantoea persica]